jgi:hypothetical protein
MKTNPNNQHIINAVSIGTHSTSQTTHFLITFDIYNYNVHNYFVDLGSSSNIISCFVCQRINNVPSKCITGIIQLYSYDVKVMRELNHGMIILALDPKVFQVINIVIVDIPIAYGLLFSRD